MNNLHFFGFGEYLFLAIKDSEDMVIFDPYVNLEPCCFDYKSQRADRATGISNVDGDMLFY